MTKHIFVTGGVVSSVGKGIIAASLGRLLKSRGLEVVLQKLDPYLNVDPSIMSPFQHGEVFVTDDGTEADLDLGHYERFIDVNLTNAATVTAGSIYQSLIARERAGDFGGGTVQVVPHLTNEIKDRITKLAQDSGADVVITEIGGTVGDIESLPFVEALRQMRYELGPGNSCHVHATLLPYITASSELKTKPTQHSVQTLRGLGLHPDFIVCRSEHEIHEDEIAKISLFCDVPKDHVIAALDVPSIYEVPLSLRDQNFDLAVAKFLGLEVGESDLAEWEQYIQATKELGDTVRIAMVGKYVTLPDAYLSVIEALKHSGVFHKQRIDIGWIDSETLTPEQVTAALADGDYDGILAPGSFGVDFCEGKIAAAQYARENDIPYLGICLGMQAALIDFGRNVAGLEGANSIEFDADTPHPLIILNQSNTDDPNTHRHAIRLGAHTEKLAEGTKVAQAYRDTSIDERHRNHYEINSAYREELEKAGLIISAVSGDDEFIEAIELADHPWFVGTQAHIEYKSRPTRPAPLIRDFIGAAIANKPS
ncbi:MAG: CTP synthase [Coriobacteriia bacterium]|nr:CTP synthase [Coriobacteriia bacterium]